MTDARDTVEHPTDEQLAAFLDDRLTASQRERVLVHLAACTACRHDMTAVRRAIGDERLKGKRWHRPIAALAAAALVFAIVPRFFDAPRPAAERAPMTGESLDGMPRITVVSPVDRALVADSVVPLQWRPAGTDATYHIAIQDRTGRLVWETTLGDTMVTIPGNVSLEKGYPYYWSVDARLADGRSAASGPQRFSVR